MKKDSYLTLVTSGGKERVAQFCKSGGANAEEAILDQLAGLDVDAMKEKLETASFGTDGYFEAKRQEVENEYFSTLPVLQEREERLASYRGEISEEHRIFKMKRLPFAESSIGCRVISAIASSDEDVVLMDGSPMAFAAEFTYTVDLDDMTLSCRRAGALTGVHDIASLKG